MFGKDKKIKETEENNLEDNNNPFIRETGEKEEPPAAEQEAKHQNSNELETLKSQYIRLAADFDNYRKRHAQERESLLKYGAEETLKKLLPVLDTFERAKKSVAEIEDIEKIKESFNVVQKQLMEALEKAGLEKIETENQTFNPELHEAVMQTQTEEYGDHTIINELQSGYKLGDRVLRPAMVNVAVN